MSVSIAAMVAVASIVVVVVPAESAAAVVLPSTEGQTLEIHSEPADDSTDAPAWEDTAGLFAGQDQKERLGPDMGHSWRSAQQVDIVEIVEMEAHGNSYLGSAVLDLLDSHKQCLA